MGFKRDDQTGVIAQYKHSKVGQGREVSVESPRAQRESHKTTKVCNLTGDVVVLKLVVPP